MSEYGESLERQLKSSSQDLSVLAYGASMLELEGYITTLAERLRETLEALVPDLTDAARFIWMTKYSPVIAALNPFTELPELVLQVAEFLDELDEVQEDSHVATADSSSFAATVEKISLVSLYVQGLLSMLNVMLLRESMGDFD